MATMVFLRVKIGLRAAASGRSVEADHPNFNTIASEIRDGMDWSHYVDIHGTGWHYDKVCGHRDTDVGNDAVPEDHPHRNTEHGVQFGCLYVPENFGAEAVRLFPDVCSIIDEESFESFYDDRAHAHEPDVVHDGEIVKELQAQMALEADPLVTTPEPSAEEKAHRAAILDPENQAVRGIRRNLRKRWADARANTPGTTRADLVKVV